MGLFDFFKKKKEKHKEQNSSNNQEPIDEFTKDMIESADYFVELRSERFEGLDFTVESLEVVETMLDEASEFYAEMDEKHKQAIINATGSYIFEVARRNFGGTYFWYEQLNQPILVTGQPDFELSILAFDKVKGRLENGEEDNIPFYFAGYVERFKDKESGMIV